MKFDLEKHMNEYDNAKDKAFRDSENLKRAGFKQINSHQFINAHRLITIKASMYLLKDLKNDFTLTLTSIEGIK